MKLAIMQPYIFPYAGYFQLLQAADKFVVYDDVNFIKGGWINRNRILLEGKDFLFTIPLQDASPNKKINEVFIHEQLYDNWKKKFYKSLSSAYRKAPFFDPVRSLVSGVLEMEATSIGALATQSLLAIKNYLQLPAEVVLTSAVYNNAHLFGKERVIDICLKEGATTYINASGGQALYEKDFFCSRGIDLYFIKSEKSAYTQLENEHVPWLSIIDVLMFNSVFDTNRILSHYSLQ